MFLFRREPTINVINVTYTPPLVSLVIAAAAIALTIYFMGFVFLTVAAVAIVGGALYALAGCFGGLLRSVEPSRSTAELPHVSMNSGSSYSTTYSSLASQLSCEQTTRALPVAVAISVGPHPSAPPITGSGTSNFFSSKDSSEVSSTNVSSKPKSWLKSLLGH